MDTTDGSSSGPSRRALIGTAALGAGAGLAFALFPRAALAQTAAPAATPAATTAITLAAQPGSAHLLGPSVPATELLTYGGTLPGPVLRAAAGGELAIDFANRLTEPTSLCFGGLRLPNAMLGVPGPGGAVVAPAETRQVRLPADEPGTYLYSPFDAAQAARGLAGTLVIEEPSPPAADRDIVLLIQDWRLEPDQRVHLTLNGEPAPRIPVRAGERVRLRIVNATRGLFLPLRLDDHPSWIIAIDGRPAEPFSPAGGRLLMAPGGRVDVLVDLAKAPGSNLPLIVEGPDGEIPLASLAYSAEPPRRITPLPAPMALPSPSGLAQPKLGEAVRATLDLSDAPATAFAAEALAQLMPGRTLVATVTNKSSAAASIQLYGHAARLLDTMDDGWKPWWHDAVGVAPGRSVRLALVAGEPGRWPIVARRGGDAVPLALAWFETGDDQSSTPRNPKKRA